MLKRLAARAISLCTSGVTFGASAYATGDHSDGGRCLARHKAPVPDRSALAMAVQASRRVR